MVTVTCQHTGVEFEARTRAAKNHPQVSAALARVTKSPAGRIAYGKLMGALESYRAAGQKPTLDEFELLADEAIEAGREQRAINNAKWQRIREERRERLNDYARGVRRGEDEEDADRAAVDAALNAQGDGRWFDGVEG